MHQGIFGGGGGLEGGVKPVSVGTYNSLHHNTGDIICRRIPLFPSLK
jgi:hypothetical protein